MILEGGLVRGLTGCNVAILTQRVKCIESVLSSAQGLQTLAL